MSTESSIPTSQRAPAKLQQRLAECYQRGVHLSTVEKNYDYAHTMFAECMVHDPANLAYAEAMIRNLRAKFPKQNKKIKLFGGGSDRALNDAVAHKEWSKVFRLAVELLKDDPWNWSTLRALAQACAQSHYNEVELVYLKQALDANPKEIEVNQHCAQSLARMGQFDQAIACWHRIESLRPRDREAPQMIAQLSEEKLKYPGGRPPITEQTIHVGAVPAASSDSPSEAAELSLSPRLRLEQAIAEDPHDVSNYLELADILLESEKFREAEATLLRGIGICGEHSALKGRLQHVQTLRAQHEHEINEARRKEIERQNRPFHVPWLELVLALAAIGLILQLFPPVAKATWSVIDLRHWSRTGWLVANVIALLLLFVIRLWAQRSPRKRSVAARAIRKKA